MSLGGDSGEEALLRQRLAKAEQEVIKATNSQLAAEKRERELREELNSRIDDFDQERSSRDEHVRTLEQDKIVLHAAMTPLGVHGHVDAQQLKARVHEILQQQKDAREAQTCLEQLVASQMPSSSKTTLKDITRHVQKRVQELVELTTEQKDLVETARKERDTMHDEVDEGKRARESLKRREYELCAAKKRLRKLSILLRKTVPGWVAGNTSLAANSNGETTMMSTSIDETVGGESVVAGRDFEADMLDEMEQLVTFVEELDGRLEFQKVEDDLQRQSERAQYAALQNHNDALREQITSVRAECQALQSQVTSLHAEMDITLGKHKEELLSYKKQNEEAQSREAETQGKLADAEQSLQEHQRLAQDDISNLHARLKELEAKSASLEEDTQKREMDMAQAHREAQGDLQAQLGEQSAKINALNETCAEHFAHLSAMQKEKESLAAKLQDTARSLEQGEELWHDESRQKSAELASMRAQLVSLRDGYQQWLSMFRLEHDAAIQEGKQEINALRDELERAQDQICAYDELSTRFHAALVEEGRLSHELAAASHKDFAIAVQQCAILRQDITQFEAMQLARSSSSSAGVEDQLRILSDEIKAKRAELSSLRMELDQEKTNRKLAEDELKQFVATRDTDETVCYDTRVNNTRRSSIVSAQAISEQNGVDFVTLEDDTASTESRINDLEQRNAELELRIVALVQERDALAQRIETLEKSLCSSEARTAEIEASRDSLIHSHQRETETAAKQRADLHDLLSQQSLKIGEMAERCQQLETQHILSLDEKSAETDTWTKEGEQAVKDQVNNLQQACSELKSQLQAAEQALQTSNTREKVLRNERSELEQDLKSVSYALSKSQKDTKKSREEVDTLQVHTKALEQQLNNHQMNSGSASALEELERLKGRLVETERINHDLEMHATFLERSLREARESQTNHNLDGLRSKVESLQNERDIATQTIEQLEHDLAVKAQECEDADDKELALRKDNKRLLAKVANLQAKLSKAQTGALKATDVTSKQPASEQAAVADPRAAASLAQSGVGQTRKRSSPDEDESTAQHHPDNSAQIPESAPAVVYAPVAAGLSIPDHAEEPSSHILARHVAKHGRRSGSADSPAMSRARSASHHSQTPLSQRRRKSRPSPGKALHNSDPVQAYTYGDTANGSYPGALTKPSDLIALRMQEKLTLSENRSKQTEADTHNLGAFGTPSSRLRDRTNRPRSVIVESDAAKLTPNLLRNNADQASQARQDNPFMLKLNRFKPSPAQGAGSQP